MALPRSVALDTNMLLYISQFKVDVFSMVREMLGEVAFIEPRQVLAELDAVAKQNATLRARARVAKDLLRQYRASVVDVAAQNADAALVSMAKEGILVGTQDKELRSTLKGAGFAHFFLRQKNRIQVEGLDV